MSAARRGGGALRRLPEREPTLDPLRYGLDPEWVVSSAVVGDHVEFVVESVTWQGSPRFNADGTRETHVVQHQARWS